MEKRTNGSLKFEIYPGSSLMKTVAQFSALRKGALDMSLYPLAYAGGEVQELNIGLMPCMVTSYEQGFAWKKAEIGRELIKLLDARGREDRHLDLAGRRHRLARQPGGRARRRRRA